ncbi:hypothetical protein [Sporisorium scitamineum]|uniref:Uncharacterized protein n=1 Tax=Sporisorium scitamineum TaxID=49012 RepID=A0A0F7S7Z7_9BASI|nr:hypothetical protein [Sporisorium scitamineum]
MHLRFSSAGWKLSDKGLKAKSKTGAQADELESGYAKSKMPD